MGPTKLPNPHAPPAPPHPLASPIKAPWPATQTRRKKRGVLLFDLQHRRDPVRYRKVLLKMAMEVEDDVFFADLSKQIALLIMDDDEGEEFPVQSPPVHVQELSFHHHVPQAMMPPPYMYEMAYRRESKGTGVFIPRSSAPTRKNRSGRSNSINNGSQRQLDKSGVAISRAANNNRLQSNYYNNSGSPKNRT